MIAEIRFKNMFSFRDEAILSFEADRSKDMESYHVVELEGDVRLLKVAVIMEQMLRARVILLKFVILSSHSLLIPHLIRQNKFK
jgi:hypothetical protein